MDKWFAIRIGGSAVKNTSAKQGLIPRPGSPLKEEMATYSSILTWETPWTEEPGGLQSMGLKESQIQLSDLTTT